MQRAYTHCARGRGQVRGTVRTVNSHAHAHTIAANSRVNPGRRLIGFASSRRTNLFTMYMVGSNGRVDPIGRHTRYMIIFRKLRRVVRVPREIESRRRDATARTPPSAFTSLLRAKPNRINSHRRWTLLGRTPKLNIITCAAHRAVGRRAA